MLNMENDNIVNIPNGLTKSDFLNVYKQILISRYLDKKMLSLIKQGKGFFHIGCSGHEAIQLAAAYSMEKQYDWLFPYYRDQALCLGLGVTPLEIFLLFLAKKEDPSSGGRQMPMHYGHVKHNIVTSSSSTGTQYLQALGNAFANMRSKLDKNHYPITIVCSGDGATSQGDFHEALNWASLSKAPIIFLIQNNNYAISVPINMQRSGGKIINLANAYDGLKSVCVNGCNFIDSFIVMQNAILRARNGNGPTLIEANVVRLLDHSSSDDQRKYRTSIELAEDQKKDPLYIMENNIIDFKIMNKNEISIMHKKIRNDIDNIYEEAITYNMPNKKDSTTYIVSDDVQHNFVHPNINSSDNSMVMVDAINKALKEEMSRNDKLIIFGEDVEDGKGGVFTATRGISTKFGKTRCFNSPLAESSIVGVAIGLSIRGYKPVVEIQFADYIWTAMMQIRNELATIRYRSNNSFIAPVLIRVPVGGYIHGGLCHSQNIESFFAHIPGLKIVYPSTALDAYGLLKAAMRLNDPVLFLEHKALYRQSFAKNILPVNDWVLPLGIGSIKHIGNDITIITYGFLVQKSIEAAREVMKDNINVEVIDLRTIVPYDFNIIKTSIKKTSKVLIVHEDCDFMGFGAELAANISYKLYTYLDSPVKRLCAKNVHIPYNSILENDVLPQVDDIIKAIYELIEY